MGNTEKAVTKTVRNRILSENCRLVQGSRMHPQDPSLPSRRAEGSPKVLPGAPVTGIGLVGV